MTADAWLRGLDGATIVLYAVSLAAFARAFVLVRHSPSPSTLGSLWLAFAVHTVALLVRGWRIGHLPIVGMYGALWFIAWSVALCFLFLHWRRRAASLGVFVLPFVVLCLAIPYILFGAPGQAPDLVEQMRRQGVLFAVHIATALFSYSCFAIAFAGSLMCLLLDREIHHRRLGFFFQRMPPLETADKINSFATALGVTLLGIAIVSGAAGLSATRGQTDWNDNAKVITAILVWLAYAGNLYMMVWGGWRGRRGATVSIACFLMVFVFYFVVNLMFARLHGAI